MLNCSIRYSVSFIHLNFILIQYLVDALNIENRTKSCWYGSFMHAGPVWFGSVGVYTVVKIETNRAESSQHTI